jgi:carboxypeptidase Taq
MQEKYAQLEQKLNKIADLGGAMGLLGWDQETYMPQGAIGPRAHQMGTLASMMHEMVTDEELGTLLDDLRGDTADLDYGSVEASTVRVMWREFQKKVKIPRELVVEQTELNAKAREAWKKARAEDDFESFAPYLEQQFDLAQREAEALGYEENPYDALLDQYEADMTYALVSAEFDAVKGPLADLIAAIAANSDRASSAVLKREYPQEGQLAFTRLVTEAVGFDYTTGRLDLSTHPFTGGTSYKDVRLTTRVEENWLPACVMAGLHEAGHGIHAQQLDPALYRLPYRYGLGLAESQSRFYENLLGRSYAFWQHFYPQLKATFPDQLADTDLDAFYKAINVSEPSFIRVEADEVTYGMHIMLRFELENAAINGQIAIRDLPEAWNARMEEYLGVVPPTDTVGILQDIHWSQGYIGYFPTYLLGSMFANQLWDAMLVDIPDAEEKVAAGEFMPITGWLAEHVQAHGGKFTLSEMADRATGRAFTSAPYLDYLQAKFSAIYELG